MSTRHGRLMRAATCVLLTAVAVVWSDTSGALGGFSVSTTNSANTAGTGNLAYTHTYQSTSCMLPGPQATPKLCTGSIAPTAATLASPATVSATDSITNNGTIPASGLTQQVSAPSCGTVQLANTKNNGNPMLPRYGTTFSPTSVPMTGSGAITFDGQNPGGYAAGVVSQAQPNPVISLGATYGLGIWFKTTSTAGGPLFGIGTSPTNATGGNDRILYMRANGTLSFIQNTGGATTTTTNPYNDGTWHFAYVTMSAVSILFVGVTSTTTIYVDGATAGSGGGLLVGYSSDTGYWHIGWSPGSVTGLSTSYFAGSLSNFVVFDTSPAPNPPATNPTNQSVFDTWASAATEQWKLDDTGTSTYTAAQPVIGTTSPCTMVDITWGFTGPTSCAVAPQSETAACTDTTTKLSAFANGVWQTVQGPPPGGTQTSTISTSRDLTYNPYVSGLHLYAPLSFRVQTNPVSPWSVTFTWPDASTAFIA